MLLTNAVYFSATQKGKVKLTVLSDKGKEAVIAILEPDQFFGEARLNVSVRLRCRLRCRRLLWRSQAYRPAPGCDRSLR